VVVIYAGTRGYLDPLPLGAIQRYEREFLALMRDKHASLMEEIRTKKALGEDAEKTLKDALVAFGKAFAA
jgi:F-type H+-transporting ATPase subunit alpha